jgi:hypothetical protein
MATDPSTELTDHALIGDHFDRPDPEAARTPAEFKKAKAIAHESMEDIDPETWLASEYDPEDLTSYVELRAGRVKVAAITEAEQDGIRRRSLVPRDPKRPRGERELNMKLIRYWTICVSMNKAYGYPPGDPRELTPRKIEQSARLSGEITKISDEVFRISGYDEIASSTEVDVSDVSAFLS